MQCRAVEVSQVQVPIQERVTRIGNFLVINGYRANRTLLKQRFTDGGYQIHETPHFLLFLRSEAPSVIIVHWFAPEEMHVDLKHYLVQELKPFGIITQSQHFGELVSGIVMCTVPGAISEKIPSSVSSRSWPLPIFLLCRIMQRSVCLQPSISGCVNFKLASAFSMPVAPPASSLYWLPSAFHS